MWCSNTVPCAYKLDVTVPNLTLILHLRISYLFVQTLMFLDSYSMSRDPLIYEDPLLCVLHLNLFILVLLMYLHIG